jgi:hypothetical protein
MRTAGMGTPPPQRRSVLGYRLVTGCTPIGFWSRANTAHTVRSYRGDESTWTCEQVNDGGG